jgi:hypothetical protein
MEYRYQRSLKMKVLLYPAIWLLVLTSCTAPARVTVIEPDAPEGNFANGREYLPLRSENVMVELGFDGVFDELLVFDFVVLNHTSDSLTINPSEFYYVLLDSATADTSKLPPRMAFHPQRVLHEYDETIEQKEGERKTSSIFGILEAGVSILVGATGFLATDNPAYIADGIFNSLGTAQHYSSQNKDIKANISLIEEEKEIVNQEIFRPCRIPPGEAVSGFVYFPRESDAECFMFCFPLEGQLFQFVYNQKEVYQYN